MAHRRSPSSKRKAKTKARMLAQAKRKSSPVPPEKPTRPRPQRIPPTVGIGGSVSRNRPHENDPITGD
jgi:hypothetical protein